MEHHRLEAEPEGATGGAFGIALLHVALVRPNAQRVALGALGLRPDLEALAQTRSQTPETPGAAPLVKPTADEYDALAKLAGNENPYGPPESVMKAMTDAFMYAPARRRRSSPKASSATSSGCLRVTSTFSPSVSAAGSAENRR